MFLYTANSEHIDIAITINNIESHVILKRMLQNDEKLNGSYSDELTLLTIQLLLIEFLSLLRVGDI